MHVKKKPEFSGARLKMSIMIIKLVHISNNVAKVRQEWKLVFSVIQAEAQESAMPLFCWETHALQMKTSHCFTCNFLSTSSTSRRFIWSHFFPFRIFKKPPPAFVLKWQDSSNFKKFNWLQTLPKCNLLYEKVTPILFYFVCAF